MSEFVDSEAVDDDGESMIDENERGESATVNDNEFIDDTEYNGSVEGYYAFINVSRDYSEANEDSFSDFDYDQELNNYFNENEVYDLPIDEFKKSKKKIDDFKSTLVNPHGGNSPDSFFYAILYTLRHQLTEKFEPCADDNDIKEDIKAEIFD